MRFGATFQITKQLGSPITQVAVNKVRDYNEYVNETIHEERVQIMRIQDFDTITAQMHIDHALQDHGAWVEYRDGKMYVVKAWITKS
jgi:carbonic anhydrase